MIKVRNVGTRPGSYRSDPMIDRWRDYNGIQGRVQCCVYGCHAWATDGAHVTIERRGQKQYIVPMCHKHNTQFGEELWVREEAHPARLTDL